MTEPPEKTPSTPPPSGPASIPAVPAKGVPKVPVAPPPKTEEIAVVAPAAPARPPSTGPLPNRQLQALTEALTILLFVALTVIPAARFGVLDLSSAGQVHILTAASLALIGGLVLFERAGFRPALDAGGGFRSRQADESVLNALSLTTSIFLVLIGVTEAVAVLVFTGVVTSTAPAVVTVAPHFVLFATLALLILDMLLIARTSFHSAIRPRSWHRNAAYVLLGLSVFVLLVAELKNLDLLNAGFFAQIRAEQSPYILTWAVFFQLIAFRMALRYPSVTQVFLGELERARRAGREERDLLERRALRAYLVGLGFVMASFFLIGGVATGRVATEDDTTTRLILVAYIVLALAVLAVVAARYIQHRWIEQRAHRKETGELVARRRLTKEQMSNLIIYSLSGGFALLLTVLAVFTFMGRLGIEADYGTDFLLAAFLVGVGPYGFRSAMRMRRIRAIDDKFPDFLRDLAEGLRAGMTLPRALFAASRGVYGALTPEIRHMSAQVEWGVSFTEALKRFSDRVRTPLIQRTVSLVNEAAKAGGSVVDILTAASNDAREIKQVLEDRRRQMGIYSVIIYVAFLVFLVVIYVLAAQFLPSFEAAVQGASGAQVGGLSFAPFSTSTFVRIFFHAALIQGIGGGLVAGVMTEGHPVGGLKHSFVMAIMSWVFFRGLL